MPYDAHPPSDWYAPTPLTAEQRATVAWLAANPAPREPAIHPIFRWGRTGCYRAKPAVETVNADGSVTVRQWVWTPEDDGWDCLVCRVPA